MRANAAATRKIVRFPPVPPGKKGVLADATSTAFAARFISTSCPPRTEQQVRSCGDYTRAKVERTIGAKVRGGGRKVAPRVRGRDPSKRLPGAVAMHYRRALTQSG